MPAEPAEPAERRKLVRLVPLPISRAGSDSMYTCGGCREGVRLFGDEVLPDGWRAERVSKLSGRFAYTCAECSAVDGLPSEWPVVVLPRQIVPDCDRYQLPEIPRPIRGSRALVM